MVTKNKHRNPSGFTIVELLVVIVVIGILAAIAIVAYSGVQNSARTSAAKSGVSEAAKKVASAAILNSDTLPTSLSSVGVNDSSTIFEYTYDNGTSPKVFCVTATVGGVSYYENNTTATTPTAGTCPGHTGGVVPVLAFTERTSSGARDWYTIGGSANLTRIYGIVRSSSTMYTSNDSGVTWSTLSIPSSSTNSIAVSSDGTRVAISSSPLSGSGYIYTSVNSGSSWTTRTAAGARFWSGVASSSDGTMLVAAAQGPLDIDSYPTPGSVYTSTDSGATWTARTSAGSRLWMSVASSADGTKLVAGTQGGYIYTSTDSGITWTERTTSGSAIWSSVKISSDGSKLLANGFYGESRVSLNGGATWASAPAPSTRYGSASNDGAIVVRGGLESSSSPTTLLISTDSGVTWAANASAGTRRWSGFVVSTDGTKFVASVRNGYMYTGSY